MGLKCAKIKEKEVIMNYDSLENYVKINKFSETIKKIKLTEKQIKLINDGLFEIHKLKIKFNNLGIDENLFLMPLLLLEGESSSLIEGTRTMIEDFAYDIEKMNNIPQWTSRNLINIYKKYILDDYYFQHFIFDSSSICQIHLDLYANNPNSKFKMIFNTTNEITRVKPGKILSNDDKPNFISQTKNINDASLILLKPSLKKVYLDDLMITIKNKLNNNELLFDHIILSHPIFETIHPFNDGNGRIGRMLLTLFFKKTLKHIDLPLYLSEAFAQDKEKYKSILFNVQINNDSRAWNEYIDYFIDCLIFAKRQMQNRINKIINLFNKIKDSKTMSTSVRKDITLIFFKHFKVNKEITIKKLQSENKDLSIQTIYKDWNIVISALSIKNNGDGYYVFIDILKILRETI